MLTFRRYSQRLLTTACLVTVLTMVYVPVVSADTIVDLIRAGAGGTVIIDDRSRIRLIDSDPSDGEFREGDRIAGLFWGTGLAYSIDLPFQSLRGGPNEFFVGHFEAEVTEKVALQQDLFRYRFAAPGGGDGVVASLYALPGESSFDFGSDSESELSSLFLSGSKVFDIAFMGANGDHWTVVGPGDFIQNAADSVSPLAMSLTILNRAPGLEHLEDRLTRNNRLSDSITSNRDDLPFTGRGLMNLTVAVPSPASATLLVLGMLITVAGRRRRQSA